MELAEKTMLTDKQVSTWLANERKKPKNSSNISINNKILLKQFFIKNVRPSNEEIKYISTITSLPEKRISEWFSMTRKYCNRLIKMQQ